MSHNTALGDVPATTGQTIASLVIDVSSLVVLAVTALWGLGLAGLPTPLTWILVAATCTVAIVLWCRLRGRHGSSLGHALLGLRAADAHTGLPPRWPGLRAVNIRDATDPLRLKPRPITLDLAPRASTPRRAHLAPVLLATLDDGAQYPLHLPCLIGRNPRSDLNAYRLAVTDLERSISRTHLAVWQEGPALVVQDMGSRGGTALLTPTGESSIPPGEPLTLAMISGVIADLRLGRRILRLEAIASHPGAR